MNSLIISAHDFRSPRRAGIHFVAAELAKLGKCRFFSVRYSELSKYKSDPRISLDSVANQKVAFENVECFLWKTLIHPFDTGVKMFRPAEEMMFRHYASHPSPVMVEWIADSDVVFFESGIAPIFFDLVRRTNSNAKTIYVGSDDLATINVAHFVQTEFNRIAPNLSAICLKSRFMADASPHTTNRFVVPHGFDRSVALQADPSPYPAGLHAVSVGSMLFDPEFFIAASKQFPNVTFHVIGSGMGRLAEYGSNVVIYDEMPHRSTLPYIKHATIGIAPYRAANVPRYLADTSLKLLQYDFFGLPAVCPNNVIGDYPSRFGYEPGDVGSIVTAINAAIDAPHTSSRQPPEWNEVVQRMLNPTAFPDTNYMPIKAPVKQQAERNAITSPRGEGASEHS